LLAAGIAILKYCNIAKHKLQPWVVAVDLFADVVSDELPNAVGIADESGRT
jgi:hypothetical protein